MKFFVAFAAVLACAFASPSAYSAYAPYSYAGYAAYAPYSYGYSAYAPAAPITVLPSGYLADTPEVAHAKAAHLAEKAKVSSYAAPAYSGAYAAPYAGAYAAPYAGAYAGSYAHGPAHITVLPSGYLADTPEVAHAKGAHAVASSHAAAAAAASPDYESSYYGKSGYYAAPAYSGAYAAPYSGYYAAPYSGYYAGAYAKPVVTPSGYLADTPEVAHAKAAHLAVKAAASHY